MTTRPAIAPRMLTAIEAAIYLGYKSRDVLDDIPVDPVPVRPGGEPRYDVRQLDAYLDKITGFQQPSAPVDDADEADAALATFLAQRRA